MASIQEGFVDAEPGVRLYFRTAGSGDPVVIPLACWTEEFHTLDNGRRVIFYDPRNRGASSAVELERVSFQNDVDDLEAIRRHFALEKITPIGWSYFGAVAARYAMDHPDRVERLVMVCGPPLRRVPYSDEMNRIMAERVNAIAPGFLETLQADAGSEQLRRFWELLRQVRTGRQPPHPMRSNPSRYANEQPERVAAVFRRALQTQGDWDWRADARRVTSPALYVFGTADMVPYQAAREWAEFLPDARILKLDGVGHHPSLEDPERFFPALETFLAGEWPEGATR